MLVTGTITTIDRRQAKTTEINLVTEGRTDHLVPGDAVSLVKIRSDQAIGQELRSAFEDYDRDEAQDVIDLLTDNGWESVADLIKEVVR